MIQQYKQYPPAPQQATTMLADIDQCAGQYDAIRSELFWHTDLSAALNEAKSTGRLVLSLRLLGRLDEQYSCANSRFFRAILYPDSGIKKLLKDNFVLHWESVRKVPVVTIDFGDGRTIKRTITGNSIHYVIRPDGVVIDALPGLLAPRVFEHELRADVENARLRSTRAGELASVHGATITRATADYRNADKSTFDLPQEAIAYLAANTRPQIGVAAANAMKAGRLAVSKFRIENKILNQMATPMPALEEDTLKNVRELRPSILRMLMANPQQGVEQLNQEIYATVFLMPLNDPWLGLSAPDVFTGLPADSIK